MTSESKIALEAVQISSAGRGYLKPTAGIKISGADEDIKKVRKCIADFIKEKAAAGFYFNWPTVKKTEPILELEADPEIADCLIDLIYQSGVNVSPSQDEFNEQIRRSITQALRNRVWFEPVVCAEEGFKGIYTGINIHFSAEHRTRITAEKLQEVANSSQLDQTTVIEQQPHNLIHDFVLNIPFGAGLPLKDMAEKVGKFFDKLMKDSVFQNFNLNSCLATAATSQIISEAIYATEANQNRSAVVALA